ncbi:cytochrome C [Azonexus hydrophilus]|uniref:Cytochrome C n=1 Tax=Azonexus hydrophilus TaxID=418702 RepID=A0A1R1I8F0_9RHOO|nr:c-type cytochrome [Azonexus hydrophilus]OMG55053.1 cytochrome C [Azonexus hydrophilus]
MKKISGLLLIAAFLSGPAGAADIDVEKAKEIYGPCAACHGQFGAGGKRGEYPRIAGQHARYTYEQLKNFQSQHRLNLPMFPYTKERELPDEDMKLVAEWLATVELPTQMPTFKGDEDALTRLNMVEKVMIVPRAEGDIEAGGKVYQEHCGGCHGRQGKGRGLFPMLAGQYTSYLQKQIDAYLRAERPHEEEVVQDGILYQLKPDDIRNILAYLTTLQNTD